MGRNIIVAIALLAVVLGTIYFGYLEGPRSVLVSQSKIQVESEAPVIYSGIVTEVPESLVMVYSCSGLRVAKVVKKERGVADETYSLIVKNDVLLKPGDKVYFTLVWVSENTFNRGLIPVRVAFHISPTDMPPVW